MVADGHPLYRAGLAATLQSQLAVSDICEASDYCGVLNGLSRSAGIGLLAVDLGLPGMNQLEGLRQLRVHTPAVKVIVIGWPEDRRSILDALAAGAHGYLPKQVSATEIADGFRTVIDGHIYVPPAVADLRLGARRELPDDDDRRSLLTRRQREVLTLLTTGKSNKEIARALAITESTVKVHVTAAFRLLGVHSRMAAAEALRQRPAPDAQPFLPGCPPSPTSFSAHPT
ncbi:LuxR C-terminal-related transcriptional regulator [Brevundimonas sp.]|uniref:LuxR C-terminal-related transcriptional regulator n=1 Tax=Brevundimonas sp. TaxID=1871086 RepID=UPI003D6CFE36